MIKNDRVYATPLVQYRDTKANIEALTGIGEGAIAYATDTNEFGSYDGTTWTWMQGALTFPLAASLGGTGIANGASASLTLPNLAITLGGGGAAQTYTLPAVGGTFALLNAANVFTAAQRITIDTTGLPTILSSRSLIYDHTLFSLLSDDDKGNNGSLLRLIHRNLSSQIVTLTFLAQYNNSKISTTDSTLFLATSSATFRFHSRGLSINNSAITVNGLLVTATTDNNYPTVIFQNSAAGTQNILSLQTNAGVELFSVSSAGFVSLTPQTTNASAILESERLTAIVSTASTGGGTGFGVGQSFYAETATNGTNQQQGLISTSWIDATNATRKAKMSLSAYDTAARLGIEIEADGTAVKIGLFGGTTAIQQVLNAYTSDGEGSAYSGLDNLQVGNVYASLTDLNQLRVAYETLRASYDDLRTKLQTSTLVA